LTRQRGRQERQRHVTLGKQVPARLHPQRREEALPQSSTEVRTAGHSVKLAIQPADNIKAPSVNRLAPAGLLVVAAEHSARHQSGLSVLFLAQDEVLMAALAGVVTPEAPMAVVAREALTEEVVEGAADKLKE